MQNSLQSYPLDKLLAVYNESSEILLSEFSRKRTCKLLRIRAATPTLGNVSRPHVTGYHITNALKQHELTKNFHSSWQIHRPLTFHDYVGIEISYDAHLDESWQWPKMLTIENLTYHLIVTDLNPSEFILTDVIQGTNSDLIQLIANRITCTEESQTASIFGPFPCTKINCCSYLIVAPTKKLLPPALLWNYYPDTVNTKMRAVFLDKTLCSKCHLAGHKSLNCSLTEDHINFLKNKSPYYEKEEKRKLDFSRQSRSSQQRAAQPTQHPGTSSSSTSRPTYQQVLTNSAPSNNIPRRASQGPNPTAAHPAIPQRQPQSSSHDQQRVVTENNRPGSTTPRENQVVIPPSVQPPQAEHTTSLSTSSSQPTDPSIEGVNLVSDFQTQPSTPSSQTPAPISPPAQEDLTSLAASRTSRTKGTTAKKTQTK